MTIARRVRRALRQPPHVTLRKAWSRGVRGFRDRVERVRDARRPSYATESTDLDGGSLGKFVRPFSDDALRSREDEIRALAARARDHRFDLLGSGPVPVRHGLRARGLEGFTAMPPGPPVTADADGTWLEARIAPANLSEARRIWRLVRGEGYVPIDWAIDPRSGFRWSESTLSRNLPVFAAPGADIKLPWELSRMQHLPWLVADARLALLEGDAARAQRDTVEFQDQIADFIATNPPRHGVNWVCTMDVAIRVTGWLVAHDLARSAGLDLDPEWGRCLARSVFEHGAHVAEHLEWDPVVRGNHYLANIAGLLHIAASLPPRPLTDAWLRFATAELYDETRSQFHRDGGNFEASVGYHRFSGEMVVHATARLAALDPLRQASLAAGAPVAPVRLAPGPCWPDPGRALWPPPPEHLERVAGIARFARAVQGRAASAPAVGDDDSGRFIAVLPAHTTFEEDGRHTWRERPRDLRPLVFAAEALLGIAPSDGAADLAGLPRCAPLELRDAGAGAKDEGDPSSDAVQVFPESGFATVCAGPLDAVLRAGSNGQAGNGGHAHCDQLAVTVTLAGAPLVIDAGTYVYSPDVAARNRFRETAAHNTPRVGPREQHSVLPGTDGLFTLPDRAHGRFVEQGPDRVVAEHEGYGRTVRRTLRRDGDALIGEDRAPSSETVTVPFLLDPAVTVESLGESQLVGAVAGTRFRISWETDGAGVTGAIEPAEASPAYGRRDETVRLVIGPVPGAPEAVLRWRIEVRP